MTIAATTTLTLDEWASLPLDRVVLSAAVLEPLGTLAGVGGLPAKLQAAAACGAIAVLGVAAADKLVVRRELGQHPGHGLQVVDADHLQQLALGLVRVAIPAVFGEQPFEVPQSPSAADWVDAWPEWAPWLAQRLDAAADGGTVTLLVGGAGVGKTTWAKQWISASKLCLAGAPLMEPTWAGLPSLTSWLCMGDLRLDADRDGLRAMRNLVARARLRTMCAAPMQLDGGSVHDLWQEAWQSLAAWPKRPQVWLIDGVEDLDDAWAHAIPRPPQGVHLVLLGRPAGDLGQLLRGDACAEWAQTLDLTTRPQWLKTGVQRYLAHWIQQLRLDVELADTLRSREAALEQVAQGQLARMAGLRAHVHALPIEQQVPYLVHVRAHDVCSDPCAGPLRALAPALLQRLQVAALAACALDELGVVVEQVLGGTAKTGPVDLAPYLDRSGSTVAEPWREQLLKGLLPRQKQSLHALWRKWCDAAAEEDSAACWWAWHAIQAGPADAARSAEATECLMRPGWWQEVFFPRRAEEPRERLRAAREMAAWWSKARGSRLSRASVEHRRQWALRLDRWGDALMRGHLTVEACWPTMPQAGWVMRDERMLAGLQEGPDRWMLAATWARELRLHRLDQESLVPVQRAAALPMPEGWCLALPNPSARLWVDGNLMRASAVLQCTEGSGSRTWALWSIARDGKAERPHLHDLAQRGTPATGVVSASTVMQAIGEPGGLKLWFQQLGHACEMAPELVPWPEAFNLARVLLAVGLNASGVSIVVVADGLGQLWACTAKGPKEVSPWQGPWAGANQEPLTALSLVCGQGERQPTWLAWASDHEVHWGHLMVDHGGSLSWRAFGTLTLDDPVTALAVAEAPGGHCVLMVGDRSGVVHGGCGRAEDARRLVLKPLAVSPRAAEAVRGGEDHAVLEVGLWQRQQGTAVEDEEATVTTWVARRADGDLAWGAWVGQRHDPIRMGRTALGVSLAGSLQVADQPDLDAPLVLVNRMDAACPAMAWVSAAPVDGPLPPVRRGNARARLDRDAQLWACASAPDGQTSVALVGFSKQRLFAQVCGADGTRQIPHATRDRSKPLVACAIADAWGWLVGSVNGRRQVNLTWSFQGVMGQASLGLTQWGETQAQVSALAVSVGRDERIHVWLVTVAGEVFTYSRTFKEPLDEGAYWRPQPQAHVGQGVTGLQVWRCATPADPLVEWVALTGASHIRSGQWCLSQQGSPKHGRDGKGGWAVSLDADVEQWVPAYGANGELVGLACRTVLGRTYFVGQASMREASHGGPALTTLQALDEALGKTTDLAASIPQQADDDPVFWAIGADGEAVAMLTQPNGVWRLQRLLLAAEAPRAKCRLSATGAAGMHLIHTQGPDAGLVSTPVT